jgi:tetratricopeptide (TPR) repeat protein
VRPDDANLLSETDHLAVRRSVPIAERLTVLNAHIDLVAQRDDLTVTLASLLTLSGQAEQAVALLSGRQFRPWEGGEGLVLDAWEQALLALANEAIAQSANAKAVDLLRRALDPPINLGEQRHLLVNASNLWLALGDALAADGSLAAATVWWRKAADFNGDFQGMTVLSYSELTYYSVLALRRLGRSDQAALLTDALAGYIEAVSVRQPEIDYFATSLPAMLLFEEDLALAHQRRLLLLRAQLADLHGHKSAATALLADLFSQDPANQAAAGWARFSGITSQQT